jgi:hypothetical protein
MVDHGDLERKLKKELEHFGEEPNLKLHQTELKVNIFDHISNGK